MALAQNVIVHVGCSAIPSQMPGVLKRGYSKPPHSPVPSLHSIATWVVLATLLASTPGS